MRLLRFLFAVFAVASIAMFFGYPPLLESSNGECSALEQRVADLASNDGDGRLTVSPLYGSASSEPSGRSYARDRYPLLPPAVGCTVAYWRSVFNPHLVAQASAAPLPQSDEPGLVEPRRSSTVTSMIARDITPNGDPISPATVFTLPMDAVAIRVDDLGGRPGAAHFQVQQGRTVLSSCPADRSTPGIAWCRFNVSLRKGNYSIALIANNQLVGQFPFTVIGR